MPKMNENHDKRCDPNRFRSREKKMSRHNNKIWHISIGRSKIEWANQLKYVLSPNITAALWADCSCDRHRQFWEWEKKQLYWWPDVKSQKQFSNSNYLMQWQGIKMVTNLWCGQSIIWRSSFFASASTYDFNAIRPHTEIDRKCERPFCVCACLSMCCIEATGGSEPPWIGHL